MVEIYGYLHSKVREQWLASAGLRNDDRLPAGRLVPRGMAFGWIQS
jgi:hypothetical protein